MTNEDAGKIVKKMSEAEMEYANTGDVGDVRFKAALGVFFETLESKLAPLLKRLTALEEAPRMQPAQAPRFFNGLIFARGLRKHLDEELEAPKAELFKRIEAVEKRLEQLQGRGLDYRGIFREGQVYGKGDVCTHSGSLWISTRETDERPPGNGWVLAVKSGG